jgi:hypothetical protein
MRRNRFRRRQLNAAPGGARWPFWLALGGAVGLAVYLKRRQVAETATSAKEAVEEYVEEKVSAITDKVKWAKSVYGIVTRELPNLPPISRAVVVAQGVLETGWGKSRAFQQGNNLFNVTAGSSWTGDKWVDVNGDISFNRADCERQGKTMVPRQRDGKLYCKVDQTWRKYPTVAAAVQDYWQLLGWSRYLPARDALERGDIADFAAKLRSGGFYTAPVDEYTDSLQAVANTVNRYLER